MICGEFVYEGDLLSLHCTRRDGRLAISVKEDDEHFVYLSVDVPFITLGSDEFVLNPTLGDDYYFLATLLSTGLFDDTGRRAWDVHGQPAIWRFAGSTLAHGRGRYVADEEDALAVVYAR